MSTTKYSRRSLRQLSKELAALGHAACPSSVAALLRAHDYALHVNVKRLTGPAHPERDTQFRHIHRWLDSFVLAGLPVLSVDTKKKELLGNFANPGATWSLSGEEVNAHDFRQDALCRAAPYGLYEVLANRGHVVVGTSADTPAFAVDAVVDWWRRYGRHRYPQARDLLLLADAGGSNSCRSRLWKHGLQTRLADVYGLEITVCHYPPGASKWNPVEHRLFSPISSNWAGIPLRNLAVLLNCLRGTKTAAGLRVTACWNPRIYCTGAKLAKKHLEDLAIAYHATCPQWNYTISPRRLELLN